MRYCQKLWMADQAARSCTNTPSWKTFPSNTWTMSSEIVSDITLPETLPVEDNVRAINLEGLRSS